MSNSMLWTKRVGALALLAVAGTTSGCAVYPSPYGGYYAVPATGYAYGPPPVASAATPPAATPAPAYVYGPAPYYAPPAYYYGPPVIGGVGVTVVGGGWHRWR
jgi:hypothetical protein